MDTRFPNLSLLKPTKRSGLSFALGLSLGLSFLLASLAPALAGPSEVGLGKDPEPEQEVSFTIYPDRTSAFQHPTIPGIVMEVPWGAVSEAVRLQLKPRGAISPTPVPSSPVPGTPSPVLPAPLPQMPEGSGQRVLVGQPLDVVAYSLAGERFSTFLFNKSVSLCLPFTNADLAAVDYDLRSLVAMYYDEAQSAWIRLATSVNFMDLRACFLITHLTTFALTENLPPTSATPGPATGGDIAPDNWVSFAVALSGILMLVAGSYYLRRARG